MAHTPHPEFSLTCPGALIASLPAVLGFVPVRSLVVVTVVDGDRDAILRSDLGDESPDRLYRLAGLAQRAGADAALAVIVDDEGFGCPLCADEHRMLAHALGGELAERGIELLAAHVVGEVAAGAPWYCADGCGNSGVVDDPAATPSAAAAVLDGRRLYASREELLDVVATADPARAVTLAALIGRGTGRRARTDARARSDIEHALDCAARHHRGDVLTDDDLSRLARALTDTRVRDTLYALAVGDGAERAEALWAHLARTLPEPWRVEALVLLAFSAYVRGDGPLTGIALDAALSSGPHRMAVMLDQALQAAMRPEQIRELAATGYRIAAQLGVRLPPRRLFGRRVG